MDKIMDRIEKLQKELNEAINEEKANIKRQHEVLEKEKAAWEESKGKLEKVQAGGRIKLDIGGKVFATTLPTLLNGKSGFFSAMFSGRWKANQEEDGSYFIDRNPSVFQYILDFMRGEDIPFEHLSRVEQEQLRKDWEYYQIDAPIPQYLLQFNPAKCGSNIRLSNANTSATNQGGGHGSVLSIDGFSQGVHTWKVSTDHFARQSRWIAIGVAEESAVTGSNDYSASYSLSSFNQKYCGSAHPITVSASGDWQDADIIQVDLDCDGSTLKITNLRTQRFETWKLPPRTTWHLYVNLYYHGDQVTIVQ